MLLREVVVFVDLEDSFMAGTSAFLARSDSVRSDASTSSSSIASRAKGEEKKIIVTNVSPRVTASQLTSFFSKFGRVGLHILVVPLVFSPLFSRFRFSLLLPSLLFSL